VLEKKQVATLHFTLTIRERARARVAMAREATSKGNGKQSPPMNAGIAVTWATGLGIVLNVKRIRRRRAVHNPPILPSVISMILALVKSAEYT
jgi:hypothetical protein